MRLTSYWRHDGSDERQDRVDDGDLFNVETHLDHLKGHVRQIQRHGWNLINESYKGKC
jgi:hypothetical protein